ncbi:MAG TPA: RagB/SusD family nutrient uptake outer membrane protein [Puia sp.]|uniref:RagB/SusD family nutrient uptake outer membrane protein n=1 Tax=Puia sp. TaxID=2045100 RepID=UPI002C356C18|nr:RagB/SusD family nutrient uptake outer membrane protein [Puia sp.]HVU96236.1 RagB/SusD family nutrient uptake outer membrane protein [Puia sp.]
MQRNIKLFMRAVPFLAALVFFAACSKKFLNTQPLNQISGPDTWKDGGLANAFVTNIYNGLSNGGFQEQELASLSDEAVFVHPGRGINTINEGTLSPSNLGWIDPTYYWDNMYDEIRACNVALENLRSTTIADASLVQRLQGEAHFMRAYFYHQLVRYYGGVPLIDHTYGLNQDYSIARSPFADCVNFIVKDCDSANTLLSGKTMDRGRASALAALALKARILLYAASDLHDATKAASLVNGFKEPDLLVYTSGDQATRWQAAKDAALAVLNAGKGYKLDLTAPASAADAQNYYTSIAMGGGSNAPGLDKAASIELIFERDFTSQLYTGGPGGDGTSVGLDNGPNGYHNWAGNAPIQQLVDDYEMMDATGSKFDWSNPVEAAAPYKNRDPRFYATILYDGAPWKPRDKITSNPDPANQIQTGAYEITSGGTLQAGLDTRQSPVENWNGTWTGYYMRKFIDPDPNVVDNNTRQYIPWPALRYTEAVLNYVEANIELGNDGEAQTWLNKIRFRAGMPAVTETGDALRQRYRNERRVELAFEEHRYHDARRWMIAPTTLGRQLRFINVVGKLKPAAIAPSPYRHDETIYTYTYTPYTDNSLENRTWIDKMYFRPISRDEVNKNSKLIQNPGY